MLDEACTKDQQTNVRQTYFKEGCCSNTSKQLGTKSAVLVLLLLRCFNCYRQTSATKAAVRLDANWHDKQLESAAHRSTVGLFCSVTYKALYREQVRDLTRCLC